MFRAVSAMRDFTVLVLPGAYAAGVSATLDILAAAGAVAARLRLPKPAWRVVAPAASPVRLSSGLHVEAAPLPARSRRTDSSTWIVPGLGLDSPAAIERELGLPEARVAAAAIAAHAARGGAIAASCSAVFLLQRAGLLAKRRVTTSWWLAQELRRVEPSCNVDADRMVCVDGAMTTAGAAFAHTDLMLHLLRTRFGVAMADTVGRILLLDGRHAQSQFVMPAMLAGGNELVARLIRRIEESLPHPPSIEALAGEQAMSLRTLSRYVRAATGRSPLALVQSVRLNHARMLIETSRMSIDRVAEEVGYADATALRRMMRKAGGASPSRYRKAG